MTTTRPEILVAIRWDERAARLADLLNALGADAVLDVTTTETAHFRTGRRMPTYRITFDGARVRNTVAHGRALDLGFVAHVE